MFSRLARWRARLTCEPGRSDEDQGTHSIHHAHQAWQASLDSLADHQGDRAGYIRNVRSKILNFADGLVFRIQQVNVHELEAIG